jgi:hypothetical protein
MPRWIKYVLLALLLLLIASIPFAMQLETGSIQGKITNDRGAVADASLEARNTMTGAVARAVSDTAGTYKLESLRAGRYSLFVVAADHSSVWVREVIVERGQTTHRDLQLIRTRKSATGT